MVGWYLQVNEVVIYKTRKSGDYLNCQKVFALICKFSEGWVIFIFYFIFYKAVDPVVSGPRLQRRTTT